MIYLVLGNPGSSIMALTAGIIGILILLLLITVIIVFIYQLRKAIGEDFASRGRNIVLGILGAILLYFMYSFTATGIALYKAKTGKSTVLTATNTDDFSCVQSIAFMTKGRFGYIKICDRKANVNGKFTIEGDTIFMNKIKRNKEFYEFAVIEQADQSSEKQLMFYKDKNDVNPLKMDIGTNNVDRFLSKK